MFFFCLFSQRNLTDCYPLNEIRRRLCFLLIYSKETQKINTLLSQMKKELTSYLFIEEKHKSENLIIQIGNQAYFSQIFSRETQDFHS